MAKVIIFGCQKTAEIAHHYLSTDSEHEVVAFCVNKRYLPRDKYLRSLPIVVFENIENLYSNREYSFFAPFNSGKMNTVKEDIYNSIKNKGYKMITFISSKASINNAIIGENCFIQEFNVLQPFSKIGNNVMMWSSNNLGHHAEIKDHVTVTSQVVIAGKCIIGENSFLGISSTIRNDVEVAKGTLVALATVITRNTKEWGVYMGNPAKEIGGKISKSILNI
jgi:sugar O-acyltransferase (sialic acid O-acetyltransferase NeuD family)